MQLLYVNYIILVCQCSLQRNDIFILCSLVEVDQCFRVLSVTIIKQILMVTVGTFETSVTYCQTIRRNILEGSHLHILRRENLKSSLHYVLSMSVIGTYLIYNCMTALASLSDLGSHRNGAGLAQAV
jgi:hypothetical protein